ncbi:MAG: S46 family peptidase, partial [Phycisphaerae bacterium]|nr:S46 family peptidase [Phycisphaerae bacterium]
MRRLVRPFVLLKLVRPPVLLFALACTAVPAPADEGMWLVSHPPREILAQRHGFEPTAAWLEHMQKSAVRMDASGSLVSRDGLVMTNHHVGSTQLERLSTAERDLLRDGFLARTRDAELRCPDMAMQVLWRIEDVTERVSAAVAAGLSPADAFEARRRVLAEIEQEARQRTGLDCEVVTLYGGARQHLYGYRRYTDVRLVMAPEMDIAFFGGDTDNFEYPRYDLDVCFFRIYENGEPLKAEHYLRWSAGGAADGDLVFVFGHPYRTQRLHTVAHLRFLRDVELPEKLRSLWRREVKLAEFRQRGPEQARVAGDEFFGVQNSRKALTGILQGLHDPELIAEKQRAETLLREVVPARGGNAENDPWDRIERALLRYREFFGRQDLLNGRYALRSELLEIALGLVRLADELPKPSAERLPEYRDAELESVYLQLYSPAPINLDLEAHRIASGLSLMAERLGADDALVAELLDGRSPTARAAQLVRGT